MVKWARAQTSVKTVKVQSFNENVCKSSGTYIAGQWVRFLNFDHIESIFFNLILGLTFNLMLRLDL